MRGGSDGRAPELRRKRKSPVRMVRRAALKLAATQSHCATRGCEHVCTKQSLAARSVALLGIGIDSAIEGIASVIVIWRFTGGRLSTQAEKRAQLVAVSFSCSRHTRLGRHPHLISGEHPGTIWMKIGQSIGRSS